jgi:5-methylcytosine-specific restriction endonuclease McrA
MIAENPAAIQSSVLALNRQYAPLQIISVRRAFCLLYKGLAEVISHDNGSFLSHDFDSWLETSLLRQSLGEELGPTDDEVEWIQAVSFSIQVPRVVRLLSYERLPRNSVKFNRRNIFLRDEYVCQYCLRRFGSHRLSLDHVVPKSRGGPTSWENIVCSCLDCNVRKGGRTPAEAGMRLLRPPRKPSRSPLLFQHLRSHKYASWKPFLASLESHAAG